MALVDFTQPSFAVIAKEESKKIFSFLSISCKKSFDDFWFKLVQGQKVLKTQAELQAQCDDMGVLASEVMTQHAALQAFLYGLAPYNAQTGKGWMPLIPPYDFTKNQDGTVTIGDLV